jgi:hypothetical protein
VANRHAETTHVIRERPELLRFGQKDRVHNCDIDEVSLIMPNIFTLRHLYQYGVACKDK